MSKKTQTKARAHQVRKGAAKILKKNEKATRIRQPQIADARKGQKQLTDQRPKKAKRAAGRAAGGKGSKGSSGE